MENLIEELTKVNPSNLSEEGLKLFNKINEIIDRNKELGIENEKLRERIKDLEEDNYAYHQLMRMGNEREYRSKFLKDFKKEYGENVMPDYDEIYKRYDKQKKQLKNTIPKSKAKEKIKEYKQLLTSCNKLSDVDRIKAINERILAYEELLGKEK